MKHSPLSTSSSRTSVGLRASTHTLPDDEYVWTIDSGANKHVTWVREHFITYSPAPGQTIVTADGTMREVAGIGSISLKIADEDGVKSLLLEKVLHCPTFTSQLVSVAQLTKSGYIATFQGDSVSITAPSNSDEWIITRDSCDEYLLRVEPEWKALAATSHRRCMTWKQAHECFGHLYLRTLRPAIEDRADQIEITDDFEEFECAACMAGKLPRRPHDTVAARRAFEPGEFVSADVIDVHGRPGLQGYKFASVIVDHYSYWTDVRCMKSKDAGMILDHIKSFNNHLRNKTGKGIKILRSDRGLEYNNQLMNEYAVEAGIELELAVAREPRDNGFVERRIRTLKEAARTALHASGLPKNLWPFALKQACWIQNRVGRKRNGNRSPYESLNGDKPDLMNALPFGARLWVNIETPTTPTFSPKAVPGHFLMNSPQSNGFVVRLENGSIVTTRNVVLSRNQDGEHEIHSSNANEIFSGSEDEAAEEQAPQNVTDATVHAEANPEPVPPEPDLENEPRPTRAASQAAADRIEELGRNGALKATAHEKLPPKHLWPAKESLGYSKAQKSPIADYWAHARDEEFTKQLNYGVLTVGKLPPGANCIRGHWIHAPKYDSQNELAKLKARLVADGNEQVEGLDFVETYAPTPSPDIGRFLLTHAAALDLEVHQVDVDSAFLHADLDMPVYMSIPHGIKLKHERGDVIVLKKALYGLKQAGRQWALLLHDFLKEHGWHQNVREPCLFSQPGKSKFLLIYVDDILLVAPTVVEIESMKLSLRSRFPIKDLGEIHEYLNMEVKRDRNAKTFRIRQLGAIQRVLDLAQRSLRVRPTPRPPYIAAVDPNDLLGPEDHAWYRGVVGMLQYISQMTRPDIAEAANALARRTHQPRQGDYLEVHKVMGYLEGTKEMYLELRGKDAGNLQVYSDADWAGDTENRKSTSGYIMYMGDSPIAWKSKQQACTAGSSFHSEVVALSQAAKDGKYMKEIGESICEVEVPMILHCDNDAARCFAKSESGNFTKAAKHIELRYHIVREIVGQGVATITRVASEDNPADIFTKPVQRDLFEKHRQTILAL